MKSINLQDRAKTFVDDEDYEYLVTNFSWWLHKDKCHPLGYAQGTQRGSRASARKHVYMHRIIAERAGMEIEGLLVDHENLNTLYNVRSNLRLATHSQSQHNKGKQCNNKSGYKGVSWWSQRSLWIVQMNKDGKKFARCYFEKLEDAVKESIRLRELAHGEFANHGVAH